MKSLILNPKQLGVLRVMVRLQKIRAARRALAANRSGQFPEEQAIRVWFETLDKYEAMDLPILMAEQAGLATGQPQTLVLNDIFHGSLLDLVTFPYSTAQLPGGTQAEAASVLEVIHQERDGLLMALKTAGNDLPPITGSMPRMKQ